MGLYEDDARIRKLTPLECERLQGFPDGWTEYGIDEDGNKVEISDTQRYKTLGNAVTVNVVQHIFERLLVDES
jgi:DNA (cytosine-5)-methyltransferase 1